MIVRRGLLRILWREALPATLFGMLGLGAYALLWTDIMTIHDIWPALLIFVQCLLLAGLLGRFMSPSFAFIYSRGYTRDAIWGHVMLVSVLSIVIAWLSGALIVWTGLRSSVHDCRFQSPDFPILAQFENDVPLFWLGLSILLASAFHYAWIRRAQPTHSEFAGHFMASAIIASLVTVFCMVSYFHGWFAWLSGVSYIVVLFCLVLGGRALHRSSEVRSS